MLYGSLIESGIFISSWYYGGNVFQVQLGQHRGWVLHSPSFHGQACGSHLQELHDVA